MKINNAETEQRFVVTCHFNSSAHFVRGWEPGDETPESYAIAVEAFDPEHAANTAWDYLNRDDRPNRYHQRSASVGDVLVVRGFGNLPLVPEYPGFVAYSTLPLGFVDVTTAWLAKLEETGAQSIS